MDMDQKGMAAELAEVSRFYRSVTGRSVAPPPVGIDTGYGDAAGYENGRIVINPRRNKEGLGYDEMLAHEYFHHVQAEAGFGVREVRRHLTEEVLLRRTGMGMGQMERIASNFYEGPAFLFAALYVGRGNKDARKRALGVAEYLGRKEHMYPNVEAGLAKGMGGGIGGALVGMMLRRFGCNALPLMVFAANGFDQRRTVRELLDEDRMLQYISGVF